MRYNILSIVKIAVYSSYVSITLQPRIAQVNRGGIVIKNKTLNLA